MYHDWHKSVAVIASSLDPRYKLLTFLPAPRERLEVYNIVKDELKDQVIMMGSDDVSPSHSSGSDNPEKSNTPQFWHQFAGSRARDNPNRSVLVESDEDFDIDDREETVQQPITTVESKVRLCYNQWDLYLATNAEPPHVDPLKWWCRNSERFHMLVPLVKKYLCVPSTSAPSESIFSTAGHIANKKRAALTPEHVDMLVFLNRNQHFM